MRADRIQGRFAMNGVLVIPVYYEEFELDFMVDTGASYCVLRDIHATKLGLEFDSNKKRRIVTASKEQVFASTTKLSSFRVGGFTVPNIPFFILNLHKDMGVAGLLGMNFLRKFRFCIEPDSATLVLRNLRNA